MGTNLTYNIKLSCESQADFDGIVEILKAHRDIYNEMSRDVHESKIYDKKLIHDRNYHRCRKLFPHVNSQVLIRAKDAVYAAYKTLKTAKKLDVKEPCTMQGMAMRLDKRLYTWFPDNQIKLNAISGRVVCSYSPYPKFQELFSKYELADPLLFFKNGTIWLAVSFKVPEPTHVESKVLGVDLGVRRTATTSEGIVVHDKDFLTRKRRLRYEKRRLQSAVKRKKSHSAKRKLKKLRHREQNSNKQYCELVANEILKTDCDTIVLEDLSSLKKNKLGKNAKNSRSSRNMLTQAPFWLLLNILSYKAPLKGKRVETVDPAYTSKNDYRGVRKGRRCGCRYYASDGIVFDADWNAAINIAARHANKMSPKRPVSHSTPFDGALRFSGRLPSTSRSCQPGESPAKCKPRPLKAAKPPVGRGS